MSIDETKSTKTLFVEVEIYDVGTEYDFPLLSVKNINGIR